MANMVVDALGREIMLGDTLASAITWGATAKLRFNLVSRVENGRVWVGGNKHPLINTKKYVIVKYAGE